MSYSACNVSKLAHIVSLVVLLLGFSNGLQASNLDSLLQVVEQAQAAPEKSVAFLHLAQALESVDAERAQGMLDSAAFYAKQAQSTNHLRNAYIEKGRLHYHNNKPVDAVRWFHRARNLLPEATLLEQARLWNRLGISYQAANDLDSSLICFDRSMALFEQAGVEEDLPALLNNMAGSFYQLNDVPQTLKMYALAYEMALKVEDRELLPPIASNYAMLLLATGDTAASKAMLDELTTNPFFQKSPEIVATLYQNIAVYHINTGEPDKALQYLENARSYSQTHGLPLHTGVLAAMAMAYDLQGAHALAIQHYREALPLSTLDSDRRKTYRGMGLAFAKLGQADSAAHYLEAFTRIVSRNQEERIEQLAANATNRIELISKNYQLQELRTTAKMQRLQNTKNQVVIGLLAAIVVLLLVVFYLFRQRKAKEKALQEVELLNKNQKVLALSLQINQKNQVLQALEQTLETRANNGAEDPAVREASLRSTLKSSLSVEADWEQFRVYFADLHQGFYEKLKERYPTLTNNDLRMCSLVKLRLTTKEIAQTLMLSVDAVKSTRYRIRKKMQLETEKDLADFLNTL